MAVKKLTKNQNCLTYTLPQGSNLNPKIIEQLDNLMSFSPPEVLRKSLLRVYMQYIIHEHESLPMDFGEIAGDIYMLVEFLNRAEEELKG